MVMLAMVSSSVFYLNFCKKLLLIIYDARLDTSICFDCVYDEIAGIQNLDEIIGGNF